MRRTLQLLAAALCAGACAAPGGAGEPSAAPSTERAIDAGGVFGRPDTWSRPEDPAQYEVPLPAAAGWRASLVFDNGTTGIWTVGAYQVFDMFGAPEVVGLDDLGRCHILASYSGKWSDLPTIHDLKWLGGLAHGDVDPRFDGAELYTGGERGNLYQVLPYRQAAVDHRLIAYLPGREIHTLVAGDVDPRTPGAELLVFTRPGGLFRCTPTGEDGRWETVELGGVAGRVRDAVLLPEEPGRPREIACVSRAGWLAILTITADGPSLEMVHEAPMGMGRVSLRPAAAGESVVLYTTHDDGRILRHERGTNRAWTTEDIYLGPQGPRGIAAGRFDADPDVETVVTFGYSGDVEVLARRDGAWTVETVFTDRHKGHWLAAAEVDGRNATDEILVSGYGARIVLLSRPPGYGRGELATDAQGPNRIPE